MSNDNELFESPAALEHEELDKIEEIPQTSLKEVLALENGPLEKSRAINLILKACEALMARATPHGNLLPSSLKIYKDTTGENLLLAEPAPYEKADFTYIAPEVLNGQKASSEADVYSLGVLLYEMLSNKDNSAIMQEEAKGDLLNWLAFSPSWNFMPSALKEIIRRCLRAEPKQRFEDAEELKASLEDFLRPQHNALAPARAWSKTMLAAMLILLLLCAVQMANWIPAVANKSAPIASRDATIIGKYEVVMLLDSSGSMAESEQVGLNSARTSRWNWARNQMGRFAKQTSSCLPAGFSLITFGDHTMRIDNCNAEELLEIYATKIPEGGTFMASALRDAVNNRRSIEKPLAVVVLTDGCPGDTEQVEKVISDATKQKGSPIKVVFFQIGDYTGGEEFINRLDNELVEHGAKYDAVSAVSFEDLNKEGFAHAVAETIGSEEK